MKIKTISRSSHDYTKERINDINKIQRNANPDVHPFERQREYTRALNATKLDKVFAKPFLFSLDKHSDTVVRMATSKSKLSALFSGSRDGEIISYDLSQRSVRWRVKAHSGFVRGLSAEPTGQYLSSCGDDKCIKLWKINQEGDASKPVEAIQTFSWKTHFTDLDHSWSDERRLATSGLTCDIWDLTRSQPFHSFEWGADTINTVRWNPVQTHVVASAASDRNIVLYDTRMRTPMRKVVMRMATNSIAWNPMEAFNFTTACEDHNLYTFDMRKLDNATCVHKDHESAVMSVQYSPTGREFVSGGYDRTVRLWKVGEGHARDIYHTKRMQRVYSVCFSADAKFVVSGSDDTNVRVWKANASEKLGTILPREKEAAAYKTKLKERFGFTKEIKRIARHKHLPKALLNAKKRKKHSDNAAKKRVDNKRQHSKPGSVPYQSVRKAAIVKVKL